MKLFRSIRWRLMAWYGLLLALILAGLGIAAYHFESSRLSEKTNVYLQRLLNDVAGSVRSRGPKPKPSDPNPRSAGKALQLTAQDQALFETEDGYYYAVWLKNGDPRETFSSSAPKDIPPPTADGTGTRIRGAYREFYISPAPEDYMLVGVSVASETAYLSRLAWILTGGGIVILAGSLLGGWWIVEYALRPIEAISAASSKIAAGDLSQRIDTQETESELGELVGVLNSTFARLDAAFARQRQFTADAAHELRTPISVILTHAQNGLDQSASPEEQREAFEACQRAAQRMRRLIESLLQLARFDGGQESLRRVPSDLAVIAQDSLDLISPLATERNIAILTDLKSARFQGDPDRIGQVLANLLTNAIQYGREGGQLRVVTWQASGESCCAVSDDGQGIGTTHLARIFDRFYRADAARTSTSGRTGLGLAISKAIVEAHRGNISVESLAGVGTTFTVRIPLSGTTTG